MWGSSSYYYWEYNFGSTPSPLPAFSFTLNSMDWSNNEPAFFRIVIVDDDGDRLFVTKELVYEPTLREFSSFTVTPLHLSAGYINEFRFNLNPVNMDGSNSILSIKHTSLGVRGNHLDQIDCICNVAAKCYKYDDGIEQAIDFSFSNLGGASIECYVPDITNPTASTITLTARVIRRMNRRILWTKTSSSLTFTNPSPSGHLLGFSATGPFYADSTYPMVVSSNNQITPSKMMYVDFGAAGPIRPDCTNLNDCRSYTTVRFIYVVKPPSATYQVFNEQVGYYSYLPKNPTYYNLYSFTVQSSSVQTVALQSTPDITIYNPKRKQIKLTAKPLTINTPASMIIEFETDNIVIQKTVAGKGGKLMLTITGPTNLGSTCYASYSHIPLICSVPSANSILVTSSQEIPKNSKIEIMFTGKKPSNCIYTCLNQSRRLCLPRYTSIFG